MIEDYHGERKIVLNENDSQAFVLFPIHGK
jgi:hypothetical protein